MIKKLFLLMVGVSALLMVVMVWGCSQQSDNLEGATLKKWPAASLERRAVAVKILTGSEENIELLVKCIDKMAALPDAGEMQVRDAASLCYTGIQLRENI